MGHGKQKANGLLIRNSQSNQRTQKYAQAVSNYLKSAWGENPINLILGCLLLFVGISLGKQCFS